jgi:hypothetical protein
MLAQDAVLGKQTKASAAPEGRHETSPPTPVTAITHSFASNSIPLRYACLSHTEIQTINDGEPENGSPILLAAITRGFVRQNMLSMQRSDNLGTHKSKHCTLIASSRRLHSEAGL